MARFYSLILPTVQEASLKIEKDTLHKASKMEKAALKLPPNSDEQRALVAEFSIVSGEENLKRWWEFFAELLTTFHDGFHSVPGANVKYRKTIYPSWFLEEVGVKGAKFAEWSDVNVDAAYDSLGLLGNGEPTVLPTATFKEEEDSKKQNKNIWDRRGFELVAALGVGLVLGGLAGMFVSVPACLTGRTNGGAGGVYENIDSATSSGGNASGSGGGGDVGGGQYGAVRV